MIIFSNTRVVETILTLEQKADAPSFKARIIVWSSIFNMIKDYPLLGIGPGTFAHVFTQYQPPGFASRFFGAHNDYLQFVSESGLALVAVMIWMIVALYRKGLKRLDHPSRLVQGITLGAMSGVTTILAHGIFDSNLHIPANALLFTVLAAMVVAPIPKIDQP